MTPESPLDRCDQAEEAKVSSLIDSSTKMKYDSMRIPDSQLDRRFQLQNVVAGLIPRNSKLCVFNPKVSV